MSINLPKAVKFVINALETKGYEAWCVGGAIRDIILGLTPTDFDVTTNAPPEISLSLFKKTFATGLKHGTVTVVEDGMNIEVTTYRLDGDYSNHRTPNNVLFVSNVNDDTLRRDFTMNAILYSDSKGFLDLHNGISDINKKIIRAVGNPTERFKEDALRILRAFRFSAQLGFTIEDETLKAAISTFNLIDCISAERIFSEIKKIILSKNPQNAKILFESNALKSYNINGTFIPMMTDMPMDFALRFAFFCSENSLDSTNILKKLKADNKVISYCEKFVNLINFDLSDRCKIKTALNLFGEDTLLRFSDCEKLYRPKFPLFKEQLDDILKMKEPYSVKHLKINGNDLMRLGYKGEEIKEQLEYLLQKVVISPELNTPETLSNLIK